MIWVWCGVALMNRRILYMFTDACKQIAYMLKQLNYAWLTTEITESTIIASMAGHALFFLSCGVSEVLL